MTSNENLKNIQLINLTGKVVSSSDPVVTDVIIILDKSSSMLTMGNKPIESVNAFIEAQLAGDLNDGATFSFITFNNERYIIIDNVPIIDVKPIDKKMFLPTGTTALNDTVCNTIKETLASNKPNNKIVVIITDGEENSSYHYKTSDVKRMIKDCQDNHSWEFIFLGANIDAFSEGHNINIPTSKCAQFNQECPEDLLQMVRQTSINISNYRRSRSNGYDNVNLVAAPSIIPIRRSKANPRIRLTRQKNHPYNNITAALSVDTTTRTKSDLRVGLSPTSMKIAADGRSGIQSPIHIIY